NGAGCGHIRANASTSEPTTVPDWLIVGIEMPFSDSGVDPGNTPGRTCLLEEGCGEMSPVGLLESWSRHMLTWINRREQDGFAPLHAEWRSRAWGLGEPLPDGSPYGPGAFVGLDEFGGMLVKTPDETRLVPLTEALE
ncbi:MAG: biotin/lipoate--protein ligase family protein, partial [Pseudomonadota bacterium]